MYATGRSWLWYVFPILFGILGGVAVWLVLRYVMRDNSNMARNCILIGVLSSLVSIGISMYLGFLYVEQDDIPWNA